MLFKNHGVFVIHFALIMALLGGLFYVIPVKANSEAIPQVNISIPAYPIGMNGGESRLVTYSLMESANFSGEITSRVDRFYIIHRMDDNTWNEATLIYLNAPAIGSALGSSGTFGANVWVDIDVTAYVTGNGMYSLALTTTSSTAMSLASRESGANAPQLIIETTP